jgi:hypothetical protein
VGSTQWAKLRQSPWDWRILRWLRRKPRPVKVVGTTDDGDEITVAIPAKGEAGSTPWTDAVRVLHKCSEMKALDADGAVLRELERPDDDPQMQAEAERERSTTTAAAPAQAGQLPLISLDIPKLVDNIASNFERVIKTTKEMQSEASQQGLNAMVSVLNLSLNLLVRMDERLAASEGEAEHLRAAVAAAAANPPPSETSQRDQLVQLALQKALGGDGNGAPNGHSGLNVQALTALAQSLATAQQHGDGNGS